jgi:uncharacterized membrane protein affecting hemolysin expression
MRKLILLTLVILSVAMVAAYGFSQNKQQQPKTYNVSMTLDQWNIVLLSISSPDDVTANQKKQVSELLVSQVKTQIAADTIKPKK